MTIDRFLADVRNLIDSYEMHLDLEGEPNQVMFYQLFPQLEGASFSRYGTPLTIDRFLADVRNLIDSYEMHLDLERESQLMPLVRSHAQSRGATLTLAAFETMEITGESANKDALNTALDEFLALQDTRDFPGSAQPSEVLARSVIEGFMPQAVRTFYLPTRSKRQATATELRQAFANSDPSGGVQ
ncbi:MAG: hypothetical protein AAF604_01410 [Acidobacteriota bacterium]